MVFENGVKNIEAAAYNGARTVYDWSWFTPLHTVSFVKTLTDKHQKVSFYPPEILFSYTPSWLLSIATQVTEA